jgi:CelD/BcsL family acetyltransferase involved in cellulose biosynthesis
VDAEFHQDDLDDLLPEWTELFGQDDRATPFQSPVWSRAWARHFAGAARPWIVTVRDGGRLVGLLPLWRERVCGLRLLRVSGEPADYCDILALPAVRDEVEVTAARHLLSRRDQWDALILGQLLPGSGMPRAIDRARLRASHRSGTTCPCIRLPGSFDAYLATLPSSRRTNIRRRLRNLDGGEFQLRVPPVEALPDVIDGWQGLRMRQWDAVGKRLTALQTTRSFRDLLVEVTTELMPAGLALVWEFVRGDEVIGSFINFCDSRAFYQYIGAFAPEFRGLAIGKVATAEGIRWSIATGRSYYDFTRGSEPYKYWYGAVNRISQTLVCSSGRPRSIMATRLGAYRGHVRVVAERLRG